MTGLWSQPEIPHKGWRCITVIDVREDGSSPEETDYATCEMCGNERIRFVHILEHDDFDGQLEVGCVCAEKLSDDYINPRLQENKLKNKAARKAKWLTRKWRISDKGNHFLNIDGYNLGVFPNKFNPGHWKYRIGSKFSKSSFLSIKEAKLALFDEFWQLTQE
ncbi:hypothetical protein H6S82_12640 [Planktothrix sp. FACHB-1355]|uniref:Uncharacterized protein n=1 Tax=Aerosakkonema funiforme FACHB-1375 TaxID=2949571 RepID=A0A926VBT1_9CYAN|nr:MULTISPECIES: hypothetical protein [Oscillatoriales]MBD2180042.1 hypothetical protein [Aerosakkonema funiforme FACHB-1375]MBD3559705.1 hypothetical protein [Planktothrix sp. FACHB-1355]